MNQTLETLKPGDKVLFGYYSTLSCEKIERETKTRLLVKNRWFSKKGGWEVGSIPGCRGIWISSKPEAEIKALLKEQQDQQDFRELVQLLDQTRWSLLPFETLVKVKALLE